jgi:hypothetical protein
MLLARVLQPFKAGVNIAIKKTAGFLVVRSKFLKHPG